MDTQFEQPRTKTALLGYRMFSIHVQRCLEQLTAVKLLICMNVACVQDSASANVKLHVIKMYMNWPKLS
jgi:hypothetical protein